MSFIDRIFRLTNEPGGLGLNCSSAGLSLAGVPLLRRTEKGFAPRAAHEVARLVKAAYGVDVNQAELEPSLSSIATLLNRGDVSLAMIAAVFMKLHELDWEGLRVWPVKMIC